MNIPANGAFCYEDSIIIEQLRKQLKPAGATQEVRRCDSNAAKS